MHKAFALAALLALSACAASADVGTADKTAVYGAFIAGYMDGSRAPVNLSQRTMTSPSQRNELGACIQGLDFPDLSPLGRQPQAIDPSLATDNIRLVDPEAQAAAIEDPGAAIARGESIDTAVERGFNSALLQVSDIAFDRSGEHAVFEFSFRCGMLCGHGGAVVMERTPEGRWTRSARNCGGWIS